MNEDVFRVMFTNAPAPKTSSCNNPQIKEHYGQLQQSHPGRESDARSRVAIHAQRHGHRQNSAWPSTGSGATKPAKPRRKSLSWTWTSSARRPKHRPIHEKGQPASSSKAVSASTNGTISKPARSAANSAWSWKALQFLGSGGQSGADAGAEAPPAPAPQPPPLRRRRAPAESPEAEAPAPEHDDVPF